MTLPQRLAVTCCAAAVALAGCSTGDASDSTPSVGTPSRVATSTAAPSSSGPDLARFYNQQPTWKDCDDGFECARLDVPLDYADPGGETIAISVNRLPAGSRSDRLGALAINPGGPGASGLDYARGAEAVASESVLERYDLVGFDPRGVGASTPVRCLDDDETDAYLSADGSPDTAAEEQRLVELATLFGKRCAERSGGLIGHVSTVDAARDLDMLRAVLGEEKLNFLGKSYGTFIGAT